MHPEDARGLKFSAPSESAPRTLTMHPEDERDAAPRMTPQEAVDTVMAHWEAVKRGDPEALEVERELNQVLRERDEQRKKREKLIAGIVHDCIELNDFDLAVLRGAVSMMLNAAKACGTARKIDEATLALEQREREASHG